MLTALALMQVGRAFSSRSCGETLLLLAFVVQGRVRAQVPQNVR
jgi:hypothetical protein